MKMNTDTSTELGEKIMDQIYNNPGFSLFSHGIQQAKIPLWNYIANRVSDTVWIQAKQTYNQVYNRVCNQVRNQVRDQVTRELDYR